MRKQVLFLCLLLSGSISASLAAQHIFRSPLCALSLRSYGLGAEKTLRATFLSLSNQDFAALQQTKRVEYENIVIADMLKNPSPFKKLPGGVRDGFQEPMEKLWKLAKDPWGYFDLLQAFEREVFYLSKRAGIPLEKAFLQYLTNLERLHGFEKAIVVTDFLPNYLFLEHIKGGFPIADNHWRGELHSVHGHRVQSILQAEFLWRAYDDPHLYAKIYKYMGETHALDKLDWTGTGLDASLPKLDPKEADFVDLFAYMYDTPFHNKRHEIHPSDFTNPEFFSGLRLFLPALLGWE